MADNKNTLCAGDKIKLDGVLFSNSQTHCGMRRRGEWFIYDGKLVNGRYRVTNLEKSHWQVSNLSECIGLRRAK